MSRRLIPLLVFSSLICLSLVPRVTAEHLPIKIYTSADGLGSGFVDNVMRDSRGFMWFCTRDGLSRFDGARFTNYRIGDKNSPPGIESITETNGGVYWITTTGGLYRFQADALSRPETTIGDRPFLNAQYVDESRGSIIQDHAGNLWYMGADLYRVHDYNGKVEFEKTPLNLPANPNHPLAVFQTGEGPDGSFWINTNQGLVRRLPDGRIFMYQHPTDFRLGSVSLLLEKAGRIWVAWGSEIYIMKPAPIESLPPDQFTAQPLVPTAKLPLENDRTVTLPDRAGDVLLLTKSSLGTLTIRLFQTSDSHVWITSNTDLMEFDGGVFHSFGSKQGLPGGLAQMVEDSSGNLWVAGRTGLARLGRKGLISFNEDDGLNSPAIFAINEAADGNLYFANGDFYITRFNGKDFETTRPPTLAGAKALWFSRFAFLSSTNEWWFLTTDKLYRFAAANLRQPLAIYDSHNALAANGAFQIFEDSHGDIWLSQQPSREEDYSLYRLKKGERDFHRFSTAEGFPQGKSASSFAEDHEGNLWFGFYEGNLVRFANERFEEFSTKDGLAGGLITDLHIDQKGRLWLSSSLAGIQRVDDPTVAKPIFDSMTTANGLSSNNVRTITGDQLGNIYLGTVRGVDRLSPETGRIKHYSVNDGLASDFVVDSHCDRSGAVWFATTNGLSRLAPAAEERLTPPPVFLGGLRIAGEQQPVSELGATQIEKGELSSTRNNLQIDFFGLDFRPGETLRYQFMLEGADSAWSLPTEQRTVAYANLKAGTYRFLVRAVSADGLVSDQPAIVAFKILPPIWLRWWFLALATLLTLALLYSFYRYRLARLQEVNTALAEAKRAEENLGKAREERLIELARVRTRIASDLHDDIGASLTQISILSEVARQQSRNLSGATLEPLKSIAAVSNELVETMSDIVWAIDPRKDTLQDLIQRMRRFASDVLTARGIGLEFEAPSFPPESPLGANARREVFLIFKESLTNIIKHSGATKCRILLDLSEEKLTLRISDNGRGFEVGDFLTPLSTSHRGGHGIFSMKKRAEEMNGTLDIRSRVGQGTEATFQLPLDQKVRRSAESRVQAGGDGRSSGGLH